MKKILIVDDNVQVTALFEQFLTLKGYEAVSLNQSSKAVELALSILPDLFIIDLMMPAPDGFKLCRMLRSFQDFKETPILIVTALKDDDSKAIAFGAGANDYLSKPFPIDELGSRVKKLLEESGNKESPQTN